MSNYNSRHSSQICDKNGNNLLMIAPVIGLHGLSNRSSQSSQIGHVQSQYNTFGDNWVRGSKSNTYFKSNRMHSNPISNFNVTKSSVPPINNLTNGIGGQKRMKMEGDDEGSGPVSESKDVRGNISSSTGPLANSQCPSSSSASQLSALPTVKKQMKLSFGDKGVSDAKSSGDRQ